jgi:hydroxymethylbilane synthase
VYNAAMKEKLTIGTRGSKLALVQTDIVIEALKELLPDLLIETKIITTKGDTNQAPIPLDTIGKAWFTAEIEEALMRGDIDLAIHSLKDVPPEIVTGTVVMPILERADPRDVLISKDGSSLENLRQGAIIGTDSSRRRAQLLAIRPDLVVRSIRGNVDTRLRKLREEHYDAIVIAAAGLARLGLLSVVTQFFPTERFVPAPGQGVLAAQVRSDDAALIEQLKRLQDTKTVAAVEAERAFIDTVGGGCKSPIGAYALVEGDLLTLYAMMAADDGTDVRHDSEVGSTADAADIGTRLARRMGLHG